MTRIEVTRCGHCPFHDGEYGECSHADGPADYCDDSDPSPEGCPLRKGDAIVTLNLPETPRGSDR